ncbi:MAG: hypothetical protein Q9166_006995 [cf. Caloplaca sp. 2 TL-2023]
MAKSARSKKTGNDGTPVAPKDIKGDVTTENELSPKDSAAPRSSRKRAGDFNDFEEDKAVVGGASKETAASTTQPKKKSKTTSAAEKKVESSKTRPGAVKVETEPAEDATIQKAGTNEEASSSPPQPKKKPKTTSAAEKKAKPSKTDGHPVVTEKTHPGGDMVETEPAEDATAQKKASTKTGAKAKASRKAAKTGKSKPENDNAKDKSHAEVVPSQAQGVHNMAAQRKIKEPKSAEPSSKHTKPKKVAGAEPKVDSSKGKAKNSKSGTAAESKDEAKADNPDTTPEEDTAVAPDQTMDEAPFKKLLKRERAKIPSVKASANAAEAERQAQAASQTKKPSEKAGKTPKPKEPKSAAKDKKIAATESTAASSKAAASKGKKRKDGPDVADSKPDSTPSEKKQKKAISNALDAATSAVGDFVNSGIEAAAKGVDAIKDVASGLGNKSIADDVTAVAEGAVEEKSKMEKATKGTAKKATNENKGKGKEEDDVPANGSDMEESEDDDFEEGDQTLALIKGFESEGEDEGPDLGEGFKAGQKVPQLPKNKDVQKQLKAMNQNPDEPGVVYVGRIPHGFYESQMRAYFGQFGNISRLRLSRNRTTGNSKHYAFIEFASSAVAKIVAEIMDNYLMFGHILKCKVVPSEDVHENLWKGANKRFKKVPWSKIEGKKLERKVGREEWGKRVEGERKRREKKSEKLKSIGYEFEAPKLKGPEDVPVREGEKAIEGPSADGGTVEEKTIVTTDGLDGSMVISEEVKKTTVKKAGKRKAEEKAEEGPLAEVVKKAKKAKQTAA